MAHRGLWAWVMVAAVACMPLAWAHKPVTIDAGRTDAGNAFSIDDIAVSQVGYINCTPDKPELWFTFTAQAGGVLKAQLGVPKIERFAGLRPEMVVLGPGLPTVEVPFAIPEGYGGVIFSMAAETPTEFDEEFTGTPSWQFDEISYAIPADGRYYLVGYLPNGEAGKFWMALGTDEAFGIADILSLPVVLIQVRLFHEMFPIGGLLSWVLLGLLGAVAGLIALFSRILG